MRGSAMRQDILIMINKMVNRKTLAIILLIASVMSFYFAGFFLMGAPIPYSEEAQQKMFYHFTSLFMGIGLAISFFIVSKIWEGTFLWKVHLALFFLNVALLSFTAYLPDVWMSDVERLALIEYGFSQGHDVSKQVGNLFLDVIPICFFSGICLAFHVGFDFDFRQYEEGSNVLAETRKCYLLVMGVNFFFFVYVTCRMFYELAYPYLFGKI